MEKQFVKTEKDKRFSQAFLMRALTKRADAYGALLERQCPIEAELEEAARLKKEAAG